MNISNKEKAATPVPEITKPVEIIKEQPSEVIKVPKVETKVVEKPVSHTQNPSCSKIKKNLPEN